MRRSWIMALAVFAMLASGALSASGAYAAKNILVLSTTGAGQLEPEAPFDLSSANFTLSTDAGNVTCPKTTLVGSLTSDDGTKSDPLQIIGGETRGASEVDCHTTTPLGPANVRPLGFTWSGELTDKGAADLKAKPLSFRLVFPEAGEATCTYESKNVKSTFNLSEGSPAPLTVTTASQPLRLAKDSNGVCPRATTLTATWSASSGGEAVSDILEPSDGPRPVVARRVREVNVATLPEASSSSSKNSEPPETEPVTRAPRKKGVVELVAREGDASLDINANPLAHPSFTNTNSYTGLAMGGHFPPDTQVAASHEDVIEVTNTSAEILQQDGHVVKTFDIGEFFSGTKGQGSDPKIVYDASSGYFFMSYISAFAGAASSEVELAVSDTPLDAWTIYSISDKKYLTDQPKLGVSADKVTMSWNDIGSTSGEEYVVWQKADLVNAAATVPGVFWGVDQTRFNVVPAVELTSSTTAYAVYHNLGSSKVGVLAITGVPGISPVSFTEAQMSIASTSAPPPALQPGAKSPQLDTGDDRLESAAWSNGELWTAGNDPCQGSGDTESRSCLRLIRISTPSMKLLTDVDVTLVGGYLMYPAVTIDTENNLWVSFSSSSTSEDASSWVAEVPGGEIGSTIAGIRYHQGSGAIDYRGCSSSGNVERFGDFSGIAVDPPELGTTEGVWAATEYGVAGCSWETELGLFTP
jgi:hypothetical protein